MKMPVFHVGKGALAAAAALVGVLVAQPPLSVDSSPDVPVQSSYVWQSWRIDDLGIATRKLLNIAIEHGVLSNISQHARPLLLNRPEAGDDSAELIAVNRRGAALSVPFARQSEAMPAKPRVPSHDLDRLIGGLSLATYPNTPSQPLPPSTRLSGSPHP